MSKAKDLRDLNLEELELQYNECRKTLFALVNKVKMEKNNERPHERKQARKQIARLLTVMTEKCRQSLNESC